ncbi:MAG: response regulator transcription factor [Thermoflavifilum sp.]|nr:response regulator transcription factor [Thermoflavifilum sp.]MCL6513115.1 response regulator transcription factor [Alicyclobacillus sp.]
MATILVVEDEEPIADILRFYLEREGYTVHTVGDGLSAIHAVRQHGPDLVLLDLMLPELDGFEVCRQVRAFSTVPIIMLTARDSEVDKVVGLELGADDYVTKPFSARELVARVKANLRRQRLGAGDPVGASVLHIGDLTVRLDTYEVQRQGRPIPLTHREFELFAFLASRPGTVFTRERLLDEVWGTDYVGDTRTVDVTIRRLREKLEPDPSHPRVILTRRGVGYYVRIPDDDSARDHPAGASGGGEGSAAQRELGES